MPIPADIPALRAGLAAQLAAQLRSRGWPVAAFGAVDRHVFVPRFAVPDSTGGVEYHDVDDADPDRRAAALAAVYSNTTLLTRFGAEVGHAISSSTEPSLMASMVVELDLHRGHRVLEIGTGTGYNAAVLAECVGDASVTTIDVDPGVVDAARAALDAAGYCPSVVCGDGAAGVPERAPFDRIIATCGLGRVPAAWMGQLADDGAIMVALSHGIVLLRRGVNGTVSGRFSGAASFMPLRSHTDQPRSGARGVIEASSGSAETVCSARIPAGVDFAMASFFAGILAEGSELVFLTEGDTVVSYRWVHAGSGSWARVELGAEQAGTVYQSGPRRLWDEMGPLLDSWHEAGRPGIDGYGVTVGMDGVHELWLRSPDTPIATLAGSPRC